jgi:hypothetical protein
MPPAATPMNLAPKKPFAGNATTSVPGWVRSDRAPNARPTQRGRVSTVSSEPFRVMTISGELKRPRRPRSMPGPRRVQAVGSRPVRAAGGRVNSMPVSQAADGYAISGVSPGLSPAASGIRNLWVASRSRSDTPGHAAGSRPRAATAGPGPGPGQPCSWRSTARTCLHGPRLPWCSSSHGHVHRSRSAVAVTS